MPSMLARFTHIEIEVRGETVLDLHYAHELHNLVEAGVYCRKVGKELHVIDALFAKLAQALLLEHAAHCIKFNP